MTYKEKLVKNSPELSDEEINNTILSFCPNDCFDDVDEPHMVCAHRGKEICCEDCWNREVSEEESNEGEIEKADGNSDSKSLPRILDSGNRREFETGAVRDMKEGKGDMASLPNAAILRLSKHYEAGARKYGRWNYTKGMPVSAFMDSALRHIFKYLDGWDDEDHLSAAAFNILGAMEMEAKHKDMQDIPSREGKNTFDYTMPE